MSTQIDAGTVQAYLGTEYRVLGNEPFTIHIDRPCQALKELQQRSHVHCSAYVSACNPFSQLVDEKVNAERHAALGHDLAARSMACLEGVGQHPSGDWPGEASYLVLGLDLEAAKALGTKLGQNAIVWASSDALPQLILLR